MPSITYKLHQTFNSLKRYSFPFEKYKNEIPLNGVYVTFERGETFDRFDRIVRIGTHNGSNQLYSRLKQHFLVENKNRSIFRKNIGRCFLNKANSNYLPIWDLDNFSKESIDKNFVKVDKQFEKQLEVQISSHIQKNFTFCVFAVDNKEDRLFWERKIICSLAKGHDIKPSKDWFGYNSPKQKIRESGLWQVNELDKPPLTDEEFILLKEIVR